MDYVYLSIGLLLLIAGADGLVRGAARLAAKVGIPSLVIGLTVVAFGTSAPELAVSISSALADQTEMAMANVVGSNIFNVLFILGVAALITPLTISRQLIRQDVPIMVLLSALVFYMAMDGLISRANAGVLILLLVAYTAFLFIQGKRTEREGKAELADDEVAGLVEGNYPIWQSLLWVIVGLGLLVFGANLLVSSAVNIARAFGLSEVVIGLTILAIGTSLPEVVTSLVASIKGQRDIAVGNVVGSCTFNLLAVLGISGFISGQGLIGTVQLVQQDFPVMLAAAFLCLPLFFTGATLGRIEGALFFGLYLFYTAYLVGTATAAPWLASLTTVIWSVVLPATVVIVAGSLVSDFSTRRKLAAPK